MARSPLHHQRLIRITTVVVAAAALALAAPALASAAVYCVGSSGVICDVSKEGSAAGLQQALDDAAATPTPDLVRIAPGTYVGSFDYTSTSEVDVQGSGTATILEGAGDPAALRVSASGPGSVVSDLEIRTGNTDLSDGLVIESAVAEDVRVLNPSNTVGGGGVYLGPGGHLLDSTVDVGPKRAITDRPGAGERVVRDTLIKGKYGVDAEDDTATWTLARLRITAVREGIRTAAATTTLRNSLISLSGDSTAGDAIHVTDGALIADHVTLYCGPMVGSGVYAHGSSGTATVEMTNSIVYGDVSQSSLGRYAQQGAQANIEVGYSNFAPPSGSSVDAGMGQGSFVETPAGTNSHVEPGFVDALATLDSPQLDLRLRHNSPLIDGGQPGGDVAERDLNLEPRIVNGDGALDPVRDMGAYQYQRRPPSAVIASPSGVVAAGTPLAFSAEGSSDPDGDALSYAWSFGDGASGSGVETSHAYQTGAQRTVTLTVTDPTGLTASTSSELLVLGSLPGPSADGTGGTDGGAAPSPGPKAADGVAPVLSAVLLTAPVFRVDVRAAAAGVARGTRVRFTLSEAAAVRFAIRRRIRDRSGRVRWVAVGTFNRQAGTGPNAVRFSGRLRVRGRTRSLRPGRYRLTLVATDAAGNRSAAKRLPFRVTRR